MADVVLRAIVPADDQKSLIDMKGLFQRLTSLIFSHRRPDDNRERQETPVDAIVKDQRVRFV